MKKFINAFKKNPVAWVFGLSLGFSIVALFVAAGYRDEYGEPSKVLTECMRWGMAIAVISGLALIIKNWYK